jgi:plastocyanin
MRGRLLLVALPAALAVPGTAAAANVDVRAIDAGNVWSPDRVGITAGDTVTWRFDGTTVAHNVAPKSPNWSMPASPVGVNQAPVTWRFDAVGDYAFFCQIHPDSMVGIVSVSPPGQPPPTPPPVDTGPPAFPNPSTAPTGFETGGRDTRRPRVSRVRARGVRNGARVRFRLSERARVTVALKRGRRTVETRRRWYGRGTKRMTVRDRRLDGRIRVEIRARDLAGNRSRVARDRVRVR